MASNRMATKHKLIACCIVLASGLLMAACGNQRLQPEPDIVQIRPPTPVILDVDMALDDILATLFLHGRR